MKKFPVGVQLYSIKNEMKADFEGTLKKVSEMGYDGVEFAGLHGNSTSDVKSWCEKYNLVPISAHVPIDEMRTNESCLSDYAFIGCKYIVIPSIPQKYRPGNEEYDEFKQICIELGKRAKSLGMTLCYHNHDFELELIGGKHALDLMYSDIPSEALETELDTCWLRVGGVDPSEYVRKYAGRARIVHLKDYVGSKTENMYNLISNKDEKEVTYESGKFEFRPVGLGVQNFPEILKACEESGTEWVVVEQDSHAQDLSPLESIQKSIEYLKSL